MNGSSNSSTVQTLRWVGGGLELIDQRALPARFEYIRCNSAAEVSNAIRDMVVRGAPAIGCAAAYGVALEAQLLKDRSAQEFAAGLNSGIDILARSRPTAVNLAWALARMRACHLRFTSRPSSEIAAALLSEAHAIANEDIDINRKLGEYGAALVGDRARVLTHCNAGALATAGHGTALGVIRSAVEAGKMLSVVATETRPFLQGARLTAWELVQECIPVTLITDSMAGYLMSQGEIDLIIVGTDRVAANGDVANKIGTYTLAVLARHHAIPFYVACPLSSIDAGIASGDKIPIEERAENEVLGFQEKRWAADGVQVRNPAFDVTPAQLVTALITEKGIVRAPNAQSIKELLSSASSR